MKKFRWLSLVVVLMLLLSLSPAMAQNAKIVPLPTAEGNWYIVELDAPALVAYAKSAATTAMIVGGKLNVNTSASQAYIEQLKADQAVFSGALARAIPGAEIGYNYQIALNAVAVKLPDSEQKTLFALGALPDVKRVTPQRIYTTQMDYSLPLINAPAMWAQLGGRENAGAGVKVAIIDSGIDPDHVLFDGTGWSYPAEGTWPKGYCEIDPTFCNGKIIATHYYTPTLAVNPGEVNTPQDMHGHGTHVGGTAAGNIVTATYGTSTPEISGVAPGAWIMAYKGLFKNIAGTSSTGSSIMLAAAIEDAIADGADVVSCSWGSDDWEYDDPLTAAYEAAVDAGLVVVFSTGNSGPVYNTTGSPTSPKFIEVGASTTMRAYYNEINVTAPEPVSPTLQSFPANQFDDIDVAGMPTRPIGPLPYIPCDLLGLPDTSLPGVTEGITQTEPYSSTGWIALIPRGDFNFTVKLDNAIAQGATAVVMYTDNRTWKGGFTAGERPIYTVMIANEIGLDARSWWSLHTGTARIQVGYPVSAFESEVPDMISDFSSRGPNLRLAIRPDLVAPGVNILSGMADGTFEPKNGTSQAAPHVAGAAALLLAQHPDWTPMQAKSALMSTASQTILDLDGSLANVMTQGSGRIDLSKAGDPGLTFDEPSHSFGMIEVGTTAETVITAMDVSGAAETYALSVMETVTDTGNVTVTVSPASLAVAADGSATFTVTVEVGSGALLQDIEGGIILSGTTHMAHVPYWARIVPVVENDILLVDDDLSELGNTDYQDYYTAALDELGLTYDIWSTTAQGWAPGFPTREVLDLYDTVVYFTGDDASFFYYNARYGIPSATLDEVRAYLAAGGKMIVFGQDAAWGMNWAGLPLAIVFGAGYAEDDVFEGEAVPQPSAAGVVPFLDGKEVDFSAGGDGAGNMVTVDALALYTGGDVSNIPLFAVPSTFTPMFGEDFMGSAMSSDPTLERVADPVGSGWWRIAHRTTFCSFGLEAVNNDTGYYTRTALLGDMFDYVNDTLTVAFDETAYASEGTTMMVDFAATMASSVGGEALRYRWDFGDGSVYVSTTGDMVTHQYMRPGTYQARVEVTDAYMHTMVSEQVTVDVKAYIFLPLVMRNY
ncbi:MAG: S8 family serine peptidase [Anaerolineae bacterium]|nr:S8 family serine peptidase [Anaerolineae bacterium]